MYGSTPSLTSAPDEGGWSTPQLGRFAPGKYPVPIVCIGDWVGPRAGLDGCDLLHLCGLFTIIYIK
jgi:hypothetical protein